MTSTIFARFTPLTILVINVVGSNLAVSSQNDGGRFIQTLTSEPGSRMTMDTSLCLRFVLALNDILAEGAIALPVTLSGGALFAS